MGDSHRPATRDSTPDNDNPHSRTLNHREEWVANPAPLSMEAGGHGFEARLSRCPGSIPITVASVRHSTPLRGGAGASPLADSLAIGPDMDEIEATPS